MHLFIENWMQQMARPRTVLLGIAVTIAVAAGGWAATAQPLADEAQPQAQAQELSATLVQTANLIQSQEQDAIDTEARLDELRLCLGVNGVLLLGLDQVGGLHQGGA